MNFFPKKQLIKLSCTYWLLSFCKILKKFLGPIQSYKDVSFSRPKWPICHEQNLFGTNHYYYFHLLIGPFYCPELQKIPTADPELWGCTIFGPKMIHLPQTKLFFGTLLVSFPSTYYPLSLCKILKKFFQRIQSC